MRHVYHWMIPSVFLALIWRSDAAEPPLALITEEFMVKAVDPDVSLYVRNKHPADLAKVPPGHVLLFIHGSSQPSEVTFDLPIEGRSWMDYIASFGWDVYLMDFRGYGGSTRAPELVQPDAIDAPIVSTAMKLRDASAVIDFILERRGDSKINLLAWSMGADIAASYASDNPEKVASLVLYAPIWCFGACEFDELRRKMESGIQDPGSGPIVELAISGMRDRLQSGVASERREEVFPPDFLAAWSAAAMAADPVGAKMDPPVQRVPAGTGEHYANYWSRGKSYYDPTKITAPTLVVVAEWDGVTPPRPAKALHDALSNSTGRKFVELKEGSHIVMIEKNRAFLFEAVQQFLDVTNASQ